MREAAPGVVIGSRTLLCYNTSKNKPRDVHFLLKLLFKLKRWGIYEVFGVRTKIGNGDSKNFGAYRCFL